MNWIIANRKYLIPAVIILYIISVMFNLGYTELDGEEPRRALISIEMLHSRNFISPTLFGWEYLNKPPVFNWILVLVMVVFGSAAEWVVRLPSLIFLLIWAFFHYRYMKNFLPQKVAALSAVFLLTCGEIYFYGLQNGGEIDVFYAFITYMQVIMMILFYERRNWFSLFVFSYLFCAIGFLTKGFPSLLFQVLTLVSLGLYARSFRILFGWQHLAGILMFSLIAGGYLYLYSFYNSSSRLIVNLLQEALKKTPLHEAAGSVLSNVWLYPLRIFESLLPWSLIFILFFTRKFKVQLWQNKILRFSLLFIICNVWVYWFFGMLKPRYSYMFFPFFSVILAHTFYAYKSYSLNEKIFNLLGFLFVLILGATLVLTFLFPHYLFYGLMIFFILLVYVIIYFKIKQQRIWFFAAGVILVRLGYAALYMPVMYSYSKSIKYRPVISEVAKVNQNRPIVFYAPADTIVFVIDHGFYRKDMGKMATPPEIFKQVPYYYYQATGHIVKYDTAIIENKKYFSYRPFLKNKEINELYSFFDSRMNAGFVLFEKVK
ncbi:MAG TPA: glycosyltransferase family 39 protein [Chitinophagaceae bacterium]